MRPGLKLILTGVFLLRSAWGQTLAVLDPPADQSPAADVNHGKSGKPVSVSESNDDLLWLVGRWRCYARQYLDKIDGPLGSGAEDMLDYLNVYFPFADEKLTLRLTDNPEARPIAAEFLVREMVSDWPSKGERVYKDRLAPMSPWGEVRISRDHIRVGSYPGDYIEFSYRTETRKHGLWLILESATMRLELFKFAGKAGDIKDSFVKAPIKDYTADRISELKRRYEKLRSSLPRKTSSETRRN